MLETDPLVEVGLPAVGVSFAGESFCCFRGRAAAIGTGAVRGIGPGCIASTVVISLSDGTRSALEIRAGIVRESA